MQEFRAHQALYRSFYSESLFRDVANNWNGHGFRYLLLLTAVGWLLMMFHFQSLLSQALEGVPELFERIPPLRVENGMLSTPADVPFVLREPSSGAPLLVIDPQRQYESEGVSPQLLLTETTAEFGSNWPGSKRNYRLSEFGDFELTSDLLLELYESFRRWFIVLTYPIVVLFDYFVRVIQVLIYALIGGLFVQYQRVNLQFDAVCRLAAISMTPSFGLTIVHTLLGSPIPFWSLIAFAVAMWYLYYGIKLNQPAAEN
mgnify:CR=1 FL=1